MARRKTHEEFVAEVKALVGEEYTVLGTYFKSSMRVRMKHNTCGYMYAATPNSITVNKTGCPKCAGNLKETRVQCLVRIKETLGTDYRVINYSHTSKTATIKHSCGDIYTTSYASVKVGCKCPECSKAQAGINRRITHDLVVERIQRFSGGNLELVSVFTDRTSPVVVKHRCCGFVQRYKMVDGLLRGTYRCPECVGNGLRKSHEQFAIDVQRLVGDEYVLLSKYLKSASKVELAHVTCGTSYKVMPNGFMNGSRCPRCRESKGERAIREWLCDRKIEFNAQKTIRYSKHKTPLYLDFYVQGVAIEYDGEQHFEAKEFFGGIRGLRRRQELDAIKTKYCADNDIPLIRIPYWEYDNIEAILTDKLLPLLYDYEKRNAS